MIKSDVKPPGEDPRDPGIKDIDALAFALDRARTYLWWIEEERASFEAARTSDPAMAEIELLKLADSTEQAQKYMARLVELLLAGYTIDKSKRLPRDLLKLSEPIASSQVVRKAAIPYRFKISQKIIELLHELQSRDAEIGGFEDIEDGQVAMLYLGLGPSAFLSFDGRVIAGEAEEPFMLYEVSEEREACLAIVEGAETRGTPELLKLLPSRPLFAKDCPRCNATGRIGNACYDCGGLGWIR
jgi:hypothetical protein